MQHQLLPDPFLYQYRINFACGVTQISTVLSACMNNIELNYPYLYTFPPITQGYVGGLRLMAYVIYKRSRNFPF